jgi:MFS family permease
MMARATLMLVLLVSCAHALVHVYEVSVPSVEQEIANEYHATDLAAGKQLTGWLSNVWRLPWGLGAVAAGWLVDRFGSRYMLVIYLIGCSAACMLTAAASTREMLFVDMFLMGLLASIYHPAGLALISHETDPISRGRALGIHGIFGSLGIGVTPFLIGSLMQAGFSWRQVYGLLVVPGVLVALVFLRQMLAPRVTQADDAPRPITVAPTKPAWLSFFVLTTLAIAQGFIYSALMSFLPRYLSGSDGAISGAVLGNYLASGVLLLGCVGQAVAGRWARPGQLERQLTLVTFCNAPLLVCMAVATGWGRPLATGLLALVHFMHQPLYNSLIADYTPPHRRSLCYGFSFAMGLGLGSFGAGFAGGSRSDLFVYGSLAVVAAGGGCIGLLLWILRERMKDEGVAPG